jgi:hypothetical protein
MVCTQESRFLFKRQCRSQQHCDPTLEKKTSSVAEAPLGLRSPATMTSVSTTNLIRVQ